jgi:hypothetical protein
MQSASLSDSFFYFQQLYVSLKVLMNTSDLQFTNNNPKQAMNGRIPTRCLRDGTPIISTTGTDYLYHRNGNTKGPAKTARR